MMGHKKIVVVVVIRYGNGSLSLAKVSETAGNRFSISSLVTYVVVTKVLLFPCRVKVVSPPCVSGKCKLYTQPVYVADGEVNK